MNLKKNIQSFKTYAAIFNFILLLLLVSIITMIIFAVRKNEED